MKITRVSLTKKAIKDLKRIPSYLVLKFQAWVDDVEKQGITRVRTIPGFHDEPLLGKRLGQRSIRLSKDYRAIYRVDNNGNVFLIQVLEVNKHDY